MNPTQKCHKVDSFCFSFAGRKKSHVSVGAGGHIIRCMVRRSCSETSNISTDSGAPKIKDCRSGFRMNWALIRHIILGKCSKTSIQGGMFEFGSGISFS